MVENVTLELDVKTTLKKFNPLSLPVSAEICAIIFSKKFVKIFPAFFYVENFKNNFKKIEGSGVAKFWFNTFATPLNATYNFFKIWKWVQHAQKKVSLR